MFSDQRPGIYLFSDQEIKRPLVDGTSQRLASLSLGIGTTTTVGMQTILFLPRL
tara:strand:+ start:1541 stop:1702 length:162 start_codon:yes stop_codon:yes gene_type:complete